jgi:SNF2 family DNA or RNA helicase
VSKGNVSVDQMVARLPLGAGHELQERAVAAALGSILRDGHRGVVLADEVGFGKTYEALAVMALLCDHARATGGSFGRVLVLCKSSLLRKWLEETNPARPDQGFPQYLRGPYWQGHPARALLDRVHVVERRGSADELRAGGLRGHRLDGRLQVPEGLYIVNHDLLSDRARGTRLLLGQLWRTHWDLIIVDEAHHYARRNRPASIFAPDGHLRNYDQGIGDGQFRHILALTATPFELDPNELVNLLALVRADLADLDTLEKGLSLYKEHLNRFYEARQRSPGDPLRAGAVQRLQCLRDEDALASGRQGHGLQKLLRKYVIRNTKSQNERRYFLVSKEGGAYRQDQFDKLDDLHERVRLAPLLPFDGPDALFYLELRELIQETVEQAREGVDRRTFITTDLRQGLSSYPQVAASALLQRNLESARRLRGLLGKWNSPKSRRLHPKVRALVDVVRAIALAEVDKVRGGRGAWFSKVLVFNKLIEGTAPQLREEISKALARVFNDFLTELLDRSGLGPTEPLQERFRGHARQALEKARGGLLATYGAGCEVPSAFGHEDLRRFAGRPLLDPYREMLVRRTQQPLFLLRAVLGGAAGSEEGIAAWVEKELVGPVVTALRRIIDHFLSGGAEADGDEYGRLDLAEREAVFLLEDCRSVDLVGRYDGSNSRDREAHRRNFNDFYNPFVLLVSRVGEEGIDLQKQCRYVLHYDQEWNPAKMEQREGRVDRVGWGRADEGFIDVRFLLLKGTYEERIFHTLMQRDQWFQVLIGSKRRELGQIKSDNNDDPGASSTDEDDEPVDDAADRGRLTPEEKAAVMLDLRPESLPRGATEVNCSESGAGREKEGESEQYPGQELSPERLVRTEA